MRSAFILLLAFVCVFAAGCSRTRYRQAADRDSYRIIQEKAACSNASVPPSYSVTPDPRSRFFDPTNPDCPQLPVPRPILNGYPLPELVTASPVASGIASGVASGATKAGADPSQESAEAHEVREVETEPSASEEKASASDKEKATLFFSPELQQGLPQVHAEPSESPAPVSAAVPVFISNELSSSLPPRGAVTQATYNRDDQPSASVTQSATLSTAQATEAKETTDASDSTDANTATVQAAEPTGELSADPTAVRENDDVEELPPPPRSDGSIANKVTIPKPAWEVIPQNCLDRMLEFDSLRAEYAQSYSASQLPPANNGVRRLTLANLMELATLNSREYQTRKEVLFTTALALTRRRYQFELNPTAFGNGTAVDYRHLRNNGITQNQLAIPTGVGVQRTLATGGEFLARFANSVVLTFNGPSGFATDIGSDLVFDFQQTIFQRDVRFELLTQAERDVIYATRDYLRFRKQLFRDIANQYYNLLLSYRGIEINAQDYFTNLRGFIQSQAEYRTAEKIPRIQVDQFEQNVLRTRSNLVNNCFALDAALDQLKFRLGLPTEMAIYLDLMELESISLKDELSVARQMISRARTELLSARSTTTADATTLANVAEVLADRMANILRIQKRMEQAVAEAEGAETARMDLSEATVDKATNELEQLQQLLQILSVRMQVDMLRAELDVQIKATTPAPPLRVLIRAIDLSSAQLQVIDLALASSQASANPDATAKLAARRDVLEKELDELVAFVEKISSSLTSNVAASAVDDLTKIPDRMKESLTVAQKIEQLSLDATAEILPSEGRSIEAKVQATVDKTIELSDRLLEKGPDGWEEIEIDANEALLTGLVQRLDLMNQRGDLADAWRQIKLAGDDLRSIVDLQATQILRTKTGSDNPFDFTFDNSETRLSVALDTPLNRRLQRNNFRVALISYNVGLRNLMAAEDSIKLDIREDLRQLALDRNQYTIAVASAALAYERVISTRLRLQFAVQNVAARDFLESQQAYTNALSAIARQHVNYITDRTELFFDLEAFDVDQWGHWSGVSGDHGPQVNTDFPATNPRPYDCLPPRVWYSPTIRQMEQIPPGEAIIMQPTTDSGPR